ncbi:type I restriction-modification methylase S subunit [Pandoraea cepalis]|uniref:Type I restriction-modification methylase S subunit n=1 Tax=Pandoraea cepalis TaxID=2508294 RepID=A0A5E4YCR6_9BURK|nr:restriction endonuclease subunit S [Pandoraea cepalis]VVE46631.1 type I restriction-modification methylase S subunit [Pandoraea cepalis]
MALYPQYKKYKPTRCAWLKEIPEHWDFKRIKNVATHNDEALDERTDPDLEIDYVDISSVTLTKGIEKTETMLFEKAPSRARRKVKDGDIIVSTVRTYLKAIAPICEPPEYMVVSTGFAVIRPKENLHSGFAGYLLQSNGFVGEVVANSVGVSYPAINASDLVRIPAVEPPLDEQRSIARFLDFKTAQFDAQITKQQALLDKLAEKRTALISHAVTKGLDPSVSMKDSKVEWLGSIPQDWKETRVKFLGELILGLTYSPDDVVSDRGTLVLRSSNVQDGKISLDDCVYVSCDIPRKIVTKVDDILICSRNGSRALIGKCALLTEEVSNQAFGAFMTVLRSKHARFLYYVLNSTLFKFQSGRFLTSTINQLTTQTLGDFEIALPSEEAQAAIVNYLDKATDAIDAQCKKVQSVIDRLTEYRAALITNAVSGKIDVRGFEIPQPAEGMAL